MTPQQIKASAPEGATHKTYSLALGWVYIRYVDNDPYYWNTSSNKWYECNPSVDIKPL